MQQFHRENLKQIKKILINCPSWIGDAVMSLPALRSVHQNIPQAQIILLANSWIVDLYKNLSFIYDVILYNPKGADRGIRGFTKAIKHIKQQKFDLAILLQNAFRPALLTWLSGIPHRWGYATDGRSLLLTNAIKVSSDDRQCHHIFYYLRLLEKLGLFIEKPSINIKLTSKQKEKGKHLLLGKGYELQKITVGIHPGAAYGEAKCWLPDRYAQLAERLISNDDVQVILFGAQQELSLIDNILSHMNRNPIVLAGETSLEELMSSMIYCDLYIANDSGPMHLAAALGIPLVALFGPTNEKQTAPLGKEHIIIKKHISCSPCLHRTCPSDHQCMTAITVDEVYNAAIRKLGIRQT
jgi:heptosyltransferase-2